MRYLARVNDVFNVRLGAAAVLRAPTVAAMAQLVAEEARQPRIPALGEPRGDLRRVRSR